jgi:hypothetical protein
LSLVSQVPKASAAAAVLFKFATVSAETHNANALARRLAVVRKQVMVHLTLHFGIGNIIEVTVVA